MLLYFCMARQCIHHGAPRYAIVCRDDHTMAIIASGPTTMVLHRKSMGLQRHFMACHRNSWRVVWWNVMKYTVTLPSYFPMVLPWPPMDFFLPLPWCTTKAHGTLLVCHDIRKYAMTCHGNDIGVHANAMTKPCQILGPSCCANPIPMRWQ